MRPITSFALHAFAAAVLTALAASSAAAQYLALGDSIAFGPTAAGSNKGGKEKWIEIQGWDWGRTAKVDGFAVKQGVMPGAKGGNVEYGWKVEAGEKAPSAPGGVRVAAGDVNGDGRADTVASPRDTASGMATGKRQHGWTTISKPLDRGSVRVKVKLPWLGCKVGARYPVITLGDGARSYRLQDVTVASCGSAPGQEGPEESITFVYGKLGAT